MGWVQVDLGKVAGRGPEALCCRSHTEQVAHHALGEVLNTQVSGEVETGGVIRELNVLQGDAASEAAGEDFFESFSLTSSAVASFEAARQ